VERRLTPQLPKDSGTAHAIDYPGRHVDLGTLRRVDRHRSGRLTDRTRMSTRRSGPAVVTSA
jgi:hypothetical protein